MHLTPPKYTVITKNLIKKKKKFKRQILSSYQIKSKLKPLVVEEKKIFSCHVNLLQLCLRGGENWTPIFSFLLFKHESKFLAKME